MKKRKTPLQIPEVEQLETELHRVEYQKRFGSVMRSTIYILITVAAVAVLVATLWMPVLQIFGSSMTPTLAADDIVISVKDSEYECGEVIAFYYNNKILVKRIIAGPGSWVSIDEDGNVSVDDNVLDEPYLSEKCLGQCDLEFPYQVPEDRYFVMGDHRSTSVDSRSSVVGCVAEEQIVGKIVFRVWPMSGFGPLN